MERIAKFSKVSFDRFFKDCCKCFLLEKYGCDYNRLPKAQQDAEMETVKGWYDNIKLPERATTGSAGYDFFLPMPLVILPGETVKFPTGIRCDMSPGWVLQMFPRSGLGFKYGLRFRNTVGIIDSDYFHSDNQGHIHGSLVNDARNADFITLEQGKAFCQGIFTPFGITYDDNVTSIRNGGFGSTDAQ